MREAARRARSLGRSVFSVDGRDLGPAPGILEAALREAAGHQRPLVLLDSYELMTALDSYLRRDLLPELPDEAMVIIAGRGDPDPGWFTGGWEALTARLDLTALARGDARRLLAARGLTDQRVSAIIDWAAGSPLALALAAEAAVADPGWNASGAAAGQTSCARSCTDSSRPSCTTSGHRRSASPLWPGRLLLRFSGPCCPARMPTSSTVGSPS